MKDKYLVNKSLVGLGVAMFVSGVALYVRRLAGRELQSSLSWNDQCFLKEAAQSGLQEIELGHLAMQRGQKAAVRELGLRLVKDHSEANSVLADLALRKRFVPPGYLPGRQEAEIEQLARLPEPKFDQQFAQCMVKAHHQVISTFEEQAAYAEDPEVREFAARTLPALHQHLRLARSIA